jgi:hypothetical protein
MAKQKRGNESGALGRLAGRGEETVTKLMDELGKNPRVTDALGRAMAAKGTVDEASRKTLARVGLAAAGEIADLRKALERLEKRLAKLEGTSGRSGAAKSSATAKKRTATRSGSSATRAKSKPRSSGTTKRSSGGSGSSS